MIFAFEDSSRQPQRSNTENANVVHCSLHGSSPNLSIIHFFTDFQEESQLVSFLEYFYITPALLFDQPSFEVLQDANNTKLD